MTDTTPQAPDLIPLVEAAAEAAVQRSLFQTIVPVIRHGVVTEMNTSTWIHKVQMDGDSNSIQAHDVSENGVFTGARVTVLFAPPHQAMIVAPLRTQAAWRTYTVTWVAVDLAPTLSNGTLEGWYQRRGQSVDFNISLVFGSTTDGGRGFWGFGLPLPAANDVFEQVVLAKCAVAGTESHYAGWGFISSGQQAIFPYFPKHALVSSLANARNSDATGAAGTGIPQISASYTWAAAGHNLIMTGSYKVAP